MIVSNPLEPIIARLRVRGQVYVLSQAKNIKIDLEYDSIMNWLSTYKHADKHNAVIEKRTPETANWIFQEPEFQRWEEGTTDTLLLKGGRK